MNSSKKSRDKKNINLTSYPKSVIENYQIISAYLVDIYYNHLYIEANKMKNSDTVPTITEGYKHAVYAFYSALDEKSKSYKPRYFTTLLTGINEFFTTYTSYTTLTISECINKMAYDFIPKDYHSALDKDQKRNIVKSALTNVIKDFSIEIIKNYLNHIIDNHDETANIELMKEKILELLLLEREALFTRFLDNNSEAEKTLAKRIQKDANLLRKENEKMLTKNKQIVQLLDLRTEQIKQLISKHKVLNKKYQSVREEYNMLKEKYEKSLVSKGKVQVPMIDDDDVELEESDIMALPVKVAPKVNTHELSSITQRAEVMQQTNLPAAPREPTVEEMDNFLRKHKRQSTTVAKSAKPDIQAAPRKPELQSTTVALRSKPKSIRKSKKLKEIEEAHEREEMEYEKNTKEEVSINNQSSKLDSKQDTEQKEKTEDDIVEDINPVENDKLKEKTTILVEASNFLKTDMGDDPGLESIDSMY